MSEHGQHLADILSYLPDATLEAELGRVVVNIAALQEKQAIIEQVLRERLQANIELVVN
jgi:hypothetical protein